MKPLRCVAATPALPVAFSLARLAGNTGRYLRASHLLTHLWADAPAMLCKQRLVSACSDGSQQWEAHDLLAQAICTQAAAQAQGHTS